MSQVSWGRQFEKDLDRLGYKRSRDVAKADLDALEHAISDLGEGDVAAILDVDARTYIQAMFSRASGKPRRVPDFEEVVQGSQWLADPTDPESVIDSFDTSGDVAPNGLLCLGETTSGDIWVLDVARTKGYVYLITEHREILPMFRSIVDFSRWAIANELWKRRLAKEKENEVFQRLQKVRFFKSMAYLREAGVVPPAFRPKRFKPLHPVPTPLIRNEDALLND